MNPRGQIFIPQTFGRYMLLAPLSTGQTGEVFLAQPRGAKGVDKLCVVKRVHSQVARDQQFVARFVDEARQALQLDHRYIARVEDLGITDGTPFVAIEFVDGKDAGRLLLRAEDRGEKLPTPIALGIIIRVLEALAYAHKRKTEDGEILLHRDVSLPNILISYQGLVKVIDFGLAKPAQTSEKTDPRIRQNKYRSMSPEQLTSAPLDGRSDVYAAGLCLWELLTGRHPLADVPPGEIRQRAANPRWPKFRTVAAHVPAGVASAIDRALALKPENRFQTADAFRSELSRLADELDIEASGTEAIAQLMQRLFAREFAEERRTLDRLKEQSRALQPDDDFSSQESPVSESDAAKTLFEETPNEETQLLESAKLTELMIPIVRVGPQHDVSVEVPALRKAESFDSSEDLTMLNETPQLFERLNIPATSTEIGMPAIAEPESLPSIMVSGSDSVRVISGDNVAPIQHEPSVQISPELQTSASKRSHRLWLLLPIAALFVVGSLIVWDLSRHPKNKANDIQSVSSISALNALRGDFERLTPPAQAQYMLEVEKLTQQLSTRTQDKSFLVEIEELQRKIRTTLNNESKQR